MSAVHSSLLVRVALTVWAALQRSWQGSALGGWCRRRARELQAAAPSSRVCAFAVRAGVLTRSWPDSRLYRAAQWLLDLPVTFARWLYRLGRPLWDGSLLYRGLRWLGSRSWLTLGLLALVMLLAPHARWDNLYALLGALAVFALYLVGCAQGEGRVEVGRLGPYFVLYAIFIAGGLALSFDRALSLRFFLFHLTCFLMVLVAVNAVRTYDHLRLLLTCAAAGLAVAALYGCYQGYIGVEVVPSQQDVYLNAGMPGRVYSFYDNPNNFAEILVMLTPLTAALTLNAKSWRGRGAGLLSLALCLAAMGMTYSRSGWIGLVGAFGLAMLLLNWRVLPAALVLAVAAIPLLPQTIWNRILTIGNMKDTSALYRIAIYEDTVRLLKDYGLAGVGLGSDVMGRVFHNYPTLYDGNFPIHTHNNYFQMWGEVGIFGLLTFLALILGQLKAALTAFRHADRRLRRILAAAVGSMAGILVIGLVEYTWFYPRNMFLFWLLFAVIAASVKLIDSEARS